MKGLCQESTGCEGEESKVGKSLFVIMPASRFSARLTREHHCHLASALRDRDICHGRSETMTAEQIIWKH